MRSIGDWLPWCLLFASLCVMAADSIQAERIQFGSDEHGICQAHSQMAGGTRIRFSLKNQHWIWVSCYRPKET